MSDQEEMPVTGRVLESCVWQHDDSHDTWHSSCDASPWQFPEGTPSDNRMKFCPFCGKALIQRDS